MNADADVHVDAGCESVCAWTLIHTRIYIQARQARSSISARTHEQRSTKLTEGLSVVLGLAVGCGWFCVQSFGVRVKPESGPDRIQTPNRVETNIKRRTVETNIERQTNVQDMDTDTDTDTDTGTHADSGWI